MERFSLVDEGIRNANRDLNGDVFEDGRNCGLVLNISETSFPHEINFTLLEPCSHVFWSYKYTDDKLNRIENRVDRLAFSMVLSKSLDSDLFRDARESLKVDPGYQKQGKIDQLSKINHICTSVGIAKMGSKKQGD